MKQRIAMREQYGVRHMASSAYAASHPNNVTWHDVEVYAAHTSSSYDPIDRVEKQAAAYNSPESPCLGAIVQRVALQVGGGYHYEVTSLWPSLPTGQTHCIDGWSYVFVGDGVDLCGDAICRCLAAKQRDLSTAV